MINSLFALAILVAYVVIHANKENMRPDKWAVKNWLMVACGAAILGASLLLPEPVKMAAMQWVGTPMLFALAMKWGAVSVISNLFHIVKGFFKAA